MSEPLQVATLDRFGGMIDKYDFPVFVETAMQFDEITFTSTSPVNSEQTSLEFNFVKSENTLTFEGSD